MLPARSTNSGNFHHLLFNGKAQCGRRLLHCQINIVVGQFVGDPAQPANQEVALMRLMWSITADKGIQGSQAVNQAMLQR